MNLSEAIRLGAMLKPQGRAAMFDNGHTCALGAALDAVGCLSSANSYKELQKQWPFLEVGYVAHPVAVIRLPLWRVIESLNDTDGWTRQQIADWVETIEAQQGIVQIPDDAQQVPA